MQELNENDLKHLRLELRRASHNFDKNLQHLLKQSIFYFGAWETGFYVLFLFWYTASTSMVENKIS